MVSTRLYESLPTLYASAGLLSIFVLESPLKYLSAALLLGAAGLITLWRRNARSQLRQIHIRPGARVHKASQGY